MNTEEWKLREKHSWIDIAMKQSLLYNTYMLVISSGFLLFILRGVFSAEQGLISLSNGMNFVFIVLPIICICFALLSLDLPAKISNIEIEKINNYNGKGRSIDQCKEYDLNKQRDAADKKLGIYNCIAKVSFVTTAVLFVIVLFFKLIGGCNG